MIDNNHTRDFSFYIKYAKSLVLNLRSQKDRLFASAWIKRLTEDKEISLHSKTIYLMLFLYFVHKQQLREPFLEHPNSVQTLPEINQDQDVEDVRLQTKSCKGFISAQLRQKEFEDSYAYPYFLDFSSDLRTYFACQNIKNFGIQCYYASSNNPITRWERYDENQLKTQKGQHVFLNLIDEENRSTSNKHVKETNEELERKKKNFAEKLKKKVKEEKQDLQNMAHHPVGKLIKSDSEERIRPTWGSNLIQVKDID